MKKEEDSQDNIILLANIERAKAISKLKNAEIESKIATIERQRRIEAADDWTYFYGSKIIGFAGIGLGALEIIIPTLIAVTLPVNPLVFVGGGLALVGGKKSIDMMKRLLKVSSEAFGDNSKP